MAEPTQRALFPGGRRPWSWLIRFFPEADRALAAEVLEADWDSMMKQRVEPEVLEGDARFNVRRSLIQLAHRYVARAKRHPESLAWSRARNARKREAAAEPLKKDTEDIVTALLGEQERGRKW